MFRPFPRLQAHDPAIQFYCPDNGRDSVPPARWRRRFLLQCYDKASDAEAKSRADFDIRWKVTLGD